VIIHGLFLSDRPAAPLVPARLVCLLAPGNGAQISVLQSAAYPRCPAGAPPYATPAPPFRPAVPFPPLSAARTTTAGFCPMPSRLVRRLRSVRIRRHHVGPPLHRRFRWRLVSRLMHLGAASPCPRVACGPPSFVMPFQNSVGGAAGCVHVREECGPRPS
jgi:hypothetical protein